MLHTKTIDITTKQQKTVNHVQYVHQFIQLYGIRH